jgi:hypothetical protein
MEIKSGKRSEPSPAHFRLIIFVRAASDPLMRQSQSATTETSGLVKTSERADFITNVSKLVTLP